MADACQAGCGMACPWTMMKARCGVGSGVGNWSGWSDRCEGTKADAGCNMHTTPLSLSTHAHALTRAGYRERRRRGTTVGVAIHVGGTATAERVGEQNSPNGLVGALEVCRPVAQLASSRARNGVVIKGAISSPAIAGAFSQGCRAHPYDQKCRSQHTAR